MTLKVINGNFSVAVHRDGKFVKVTPETGAFDFTKGEIADIEAAHGKDALRDPKNEAPVDAGSGSAATAESVVRTLLADDANLNAEGVLTMAVLNSALKAAGLPNISAADRDALIEQISGENL